MSYKKKASLYKGLSVSWVGSICYLVVGFYQPFVQATHYEEPVSSKNQTKNLKKSVNKYLSFFKNDAGLAIRQLAAQGKIRPLQKILEQYPDQVNEVGVSGKTALYFSVMKDQFKVFCLLLNHGACIDTVVTKPPMSLRTVLSKDPKKYKKYIDKLDKTSCSSLKEETLTFPLRSCYLLGNNVKENVDMAKNILEIGCGLWESPEDLFPDIKYTCPEVIDILYAFPKSHLDIVDKKDMHLFIKNTLKKRDAYLQVWKTCIQKVDEFKKEMDSSYYSLKKDIDIKQVSFFHKNILDFSFKKKYQLILALNSLCYVDKKKLPALLPKIVNSLDEGGLFYLDMFSFIYILEAHLEKKFDGLSQEKIHALNDKRNQLMKRFNTKLVHLKTPSSLTYRDYKRAPKKTFITLRCFDTAVIQKNIKN